MGKSSSGKTTLLNILVSLDTQTDGKMQVIIVDHANLNNDDFQSAVIEKWWNEEILIPESWYKN